MPWRWSVAWGLAGAGQDWPATVVTERGLGEEVVMCHGGKEDRRRLPTTNRGLMLKIVRGGFHKMSSATLISGRRE